MATTVTAKDIDLSLEVDHYTSYKGQNPVPIPAPPQVQLTGTTFNSVSFTLTAVTGLIRRTPYLGNTALTPISAGATSYTFTGLSANTQYTLSFTDTNSSGESSTSVPIVVTTDNPPVFVPTAPVIALVTQDATSATLSLTSGASTATSFLPTVNGTPRADLVFTTFPATITGLPSATGFSILVTPSNSAGAGTASNTVTGTTDAAPTGSQFLVRSFIYGSPDWSNPDDEITREAYCDLLCYTLHPGLSASNYSSRIAAVKAKQTALGLTINTKFLAYINCSEVQARSSAGVWGPFYDLINTNNWFARTAYPAGTITEIQWPAINLASPRLVGGLTSGESFVDLHFSTMSTLLSQVDGILLDNVNFAWPSSFDYNEDGASDSANSVAMRNAMISGWTKVINRVKHNKPGSLIYVNPRISQNYLKDGLDDRAAFKALNLDGFMNQNGGPGLSYMDYGVFAFIGTPASPWTHVRGPYPTSIAQPTSTPTAKFLYRTDFCGFKRSTTIPTGGVPLKWGDTAYELNSYAYVANKQNILQEVYGYFDEANPSWPWAKQWNRLCLGLWYVMTDLSPYLYGVDSTPSKSGVCITLPEQYWFRNQVAVDAPGWTRSPNFTANGIDGWYRRWPNGCLILWPRAEESAFSVANFPSLPVSTTITTPPLPPGKTSYQDFSGATIGGTITLPYDSCTWLKAF